LKDLLSFYRKASSFRLASYASGSYFDIGSFFIGIVLHCLNTSFEPLFYTKSEYDAGNILILGVAAEFHGKII